MTKVNSLLTVDEAIERMYSVYSDCYAIVGVPPTYITIPMDWLSVVLKRLSADFKWVGMSVLLGSVDHPVCSFDTDKFLNLHAQRDLLRGVKYDS